MTETTHEESDRHHLWTLIRRIRFALLTSRNAQGQLHARPLATQNTEAYSDDKLYFFIAADSEVAADAERDAVVGVVYADPGDSRYVSISGQARVLIDTQLQMELWSSAAIVWFPGGVEDPNLRLLEIHIEEAEYWDSKSSKLMQTFKMAAAVAAGRKGADLGVHRDVAMD